MIQKKRFIYKILVLIISLFPFFSFGATANSAGNITLKDGEYASKWTYQDKTTGQSQLFQFVYEKIGDNKFQLKQVFEGQNGSGNNIVNWKDGADTGKYNNLISTWNDSAKSNASLYADNDTMLQVGGKAELQSMTAGVFFGKIQDSTIKTTADLVAASKVSGLGTFSANNNEVRNGVDGGKYRSGSNDATDVFAEESKKLANTFAMTPTYTNQPSTSGSSPTYKNDATSSCDNTTGCTYVLMAPIGGFLGDSNGIYTINKDDKDGLCTLLNSWFRIGIALAGMLAVVMIVLGGFQYATTDSLFDKSDGKGKIQNALWGLLLALTTWLILETINPALTKCTIDAGEVELSAQQVSSGAVVGAQVGASATGSTGSGATVGAQAGATASGGSSGSGETITEAPDGGTVITTTGVRLDSDGRVAPSYNDPTRQWETSYKPTGRSMDATTEAYVVAPMNSSGKATVPMGTTVLIQNETTGKQVWAVVGDAGPSKNGWGEMSVYAAQQIGSADGKSDSAADNHKIKLTYYK